MKLQVFIVLLFSISVIFISCRKEETELITAPEDEILTPESSVVLLMQRTASNDGSIDNIIDNANCFDIAFPYTVNVNGQTIAINSDFDYNLVECVFEEEDDDNDTIDLMFPITIILNDYSEVTIDTLTALNTYAANCSGENVTDDDIECLDFQYPIVASLFNSNSELIDIISLTNDNELYLFIENIDANDFITIEFPITTILADNTQIVINNLDELELAIENAIDICDEDDDYDYNDDDCNNCTQAQVETFLTGCSDWMVNRLLRNDTNYDSAYEGYAFNFFEDGTLSVFWNTTTVFGTWTTSGAANNIEILIDIPSLPLCNNNWILYEIKQCSSETEIDLRVGTIDRLKYENNCN
ncbi:hypothetical protein [uncultured Psychroserpens sp.]|uniref:hypothetical protein n=1 Tax=uncultured Psychroserpens sp. TaxID=255436 RepID=UPI002606A29C|nr:hypothetical protein [uncultured Psychroserpens sp.]